MIDKGSTTYGLNKAGFTLHSAIHEGRPDLNAIIHIHSGVAAGLASLKHGFLPISQESFICNPITYHDYAGILVDAPMKAKIISDLGPRSRVLALRNHGVVLCGTAMEDAWALLVMFMVACEIQFHALAAANGMQNVIVPSMDILKQVQQVLMKGVNEKSADGIDWKLGEMETEAEMRRLDRLVIFVLFFILNLTHISDNSKLYFILEFVSITSFFVLNFVVLNLFISIFNLKGYNTGYPYKKPPMKSTK